MAQTGGHNITTRRSPRPDGPNAHALSRLVNTPQRRASAFALKTSFMLRAIIQFQLKDKLKKANRQGRRVWGESKERRNFFALLCGVSLASFAVRSGISPLAPLRHSSAQRDNVSGGPVCTKNGGNGAQEYSAIQPERPSIN